MNSFWSYFVISNKRQIVLAARRGKTDTRIKRKLLTTQIKISISTHFVVCPWQNLSFSGTPLTELDPNSFKYASEYRNIWNIISLVFIVTPRKNKVDGLTHDPCDSHQANRGLVTLLVRDIQSNTRRRWKYARKYMKYHIPINTSNNIAAMYASFKPKKIQMGTKPMTAMVFFSNMTNGEPGSIIVITIMLSTVCRKHVHLYTIDIKQLPSPV